LLDKRAKQHHLAAMTFASPEASQSVRLLAAAKINLHLRVAPPTADGFHPLLTWMCAISLFDILTLSIGEPVPMAHAIGLSCDDPALPTDSSNLVVRAGQLVARKIESTIPQGGATREGALPLSLKSVRVLLEKHIPAGAGLGGGSADGAVMMQAVNRIWGAGMSAAELAALSSKCGSDLPFFFHGPSSICTGRGEQVRPIAVPAVKWGVLILPGIAMPTPAVYRKFDEMKLGRPGNVIDDVDWNAWTGLPAMELLPRLVNDLEAPAFAICPQLGAMRSEIELQLRRPVRMSGSGSSLFTLFDDRAEAEDAAGEIAKKINARAIGIEVAPV
jgi:4-diphosphocytidyl-2-C-methyl-D-erythritol kinase